MPFFLCPEIPFFIGVSLDTLATKIFKLTRVIVFCSKHQFGFSVFTDVYYIAPAVIFLLLSVYTENTENPGFTKKKTTSVNNNHRGSFSCNE